jgi:hypothetical protein
MQKKTIMAMASFQVASLLENNQDQNRGGKLLSLIDMQN